MLVMDAYRGQYNDDEMDEWNLVIINNNFSFELEGKI